MTFLAGLIVRSPELNNPTVLVVTDRNDLDGQLFSTLTPRAATCVNRPSKSTAKTG